MIERCGDPGCSGYGKQYVDRGFGYPVCVSEKQSLRPIKMNPLFEGQYDTEVKK